MSQSDDFKLYELTEADIDKAIHILTVFNQKPATPEEAIDFLEWLRTEVHMEAHDKTTEELIAMYNKVAKKKA